MRQLAGQPVQVVHKDLVHQPLVHEVTELRKLRTVQRRARIVFSEDMGVWHGIAFLLRHGLTRLKLGGKRVALVGLIRGRDTDTDGRWQQARGV